MSKAIEVSDLTKTFRTPVRDAGLRAAFGSVVRRRYREVEAVRDLAFGIDAGSVVGFIGPNGAGKTTTMKMLTGILHPTSGDLRVLGHLPARREPAFLRRLVLLRGSQPITGPADLTVADHFRYRALLYDVSAGDAARRAAELESVLGLGDLMPRQVRGLSLGQRMRAALGLALLHYPDVVFLDEPTIGLDASSALAFREYVRSFAALTGATVMLTSHHLAEVESLCPRVLLIDKGSLRYDGSLSRFAAKVMSWKEIRVTPPSAVERAALRGYGEVVGESDGQVALRVPRDRTAEITARILADVRPLDLSVVDPPLDVVMDTYYRNTGGAA